MQIVKAFLFQVFILLHFLLSLVSNIIANEEESWAERTLQRMSQEEKIGQLFMIAGYVDPEFAALETGNSQIIQEMDHYITQYHVGGIAYVGPSDSVKQVLLSNHYQELSKYPILIAQDLEWGLSMRIKDGMNFPKNLTLGAIQEDLLIYEMGKEIGRQAKLVGVHMNLSPVIDVNTNPENIVINVRSFGSSPYKVAKKGIAMICGMQDVGIIASAKHFPGIGDITTDPHLQLPYSFHGKKRLQQVELFPFVQAIKAGVLSIQTEHLMISALEPDVKTPSSLSPNIVTDLLREELGFQGLILSGALRMKALTHLFSDEEIVLKAFLAGSDMLLMPHDFIKAYRVLQKSLVQGKITERDLNERVLKILQMKERVKLNCQKVIPIPTEEQLHSRSARELKKKLYQSAVSLVRNESALIPFSCIKGPIAYIQLGDASPSYFKKLSQRLTLESFIFPLDEGKWQEEEQKLLLNINRYSLVILAVYPADPRRIVEIRLMNEKRQREALENFHIHGMPDSFNHLIGMLKPYQEKMIVSFFGNPYGLHFFDDYSTVIMGHEPEPDSEEAIVISLFGQLTDYF